jgi:hypothetical protein
MANFWADMGRPGLDRAPTDRISPGVTGRGSPGGKDGL